MNQVELNHRSHLVNPSEFGIAKVVNLSTSAGSKFDKARAFGSMAVSTFTHRLVLSTPGVLLPRCLRVSRDLADFFNVNSLSTGWRDPASVLRCITSPAENGSFVVTRLSAHTWL